MNTPMTTSPRRPTVSAFRVACATAGAGALLALGCIGSPHDPAATQPVTVVDPATTQASYWYGRPAAASVQGRDFDALWDAAKDQVRHYLFTLDRADARSGVITTAPMVSKQIFEPWRPDTGTLGGTVANTLGTVRRTLRFEVDRNPDETFTLVPKVLVERYSIFERRVTDVSQYRFAFSGPSAQMSARQAVALDPDVYPDVPVRYWYPVGRDTAMEKEVAERLRRDLEKRGAAAAR